MSKKTFTSSGKIMSFVGRKKELAALNSLLKKNIASFVVIRGRRRIGKSRLIEEFAKPFQFYQFSGVPPTDKTTAQSERNEFSSQLAYQSFPRVHAEDWNDLFWLLAEKVIKGRVIILLDEISWMGSKDPDFLGKLKNVWDIHFKKNPKLILIVCGSASSWIETNILESTGFVGRVSSVLTLEELPLKDCEPFWGANAHNISAMEKLKILAITGGVPRYLEEILPSLSAEENIKKLCFMKGALLVNEFEQIFSNIFLRDSNTYKKILQILASGEKSFENIRSQLGVKSGNILAYLKELVLSGFVKRDYTWHLKQGEDAKLSHFRLSDNYLRFYLKYIEKNKTKIDRNSFEFKSLAALPGWNSIMALQFENLVLNNREIIWQFLNIKPEDILSENPFFQNKTTKQLGCQIDYLIQTRFDVLYVVEIKFSRNEISYEIINEIQTKINRIKRPKNMSCRPVLIHVNGVNSEVEDNGYFSDIIDYSSVF
jgi:AAA+ ATPase superfamily predicted ATPase